MLEILPRPATWPAFLASVVLGLSAFALPIWAETAAADPIPTGELLVAQVNQVRLTAGLGELVRNGQLDELASERSADMAARGYFSHTTPEGFDVSSFLSRDGIRFAVVAENLAWTTSRTNQADASVLRSFLDSPPHRSNLLNPWVNSAGVGVAHAGNQLYFTLVLVG